MGGERRLACTGRRRGRGPVRSLRGQRRAGPRAATRGAPAAGSWPTHERTAARLVGMSPAGVSRLARAPASAGAACCGQAAAGPYAARQRWGRALGGTGLECQELGYAI